LSAAIATRFVAPRASSVAVLLALATHTAFAQVATTASLDFDTTFDTTFDDRSEPVVHYVAEYRLRDAPHRLEVWRDRGRIRRRTDAAIETYLGKPPASDEWTMTVLDLRRRIRTDIARTNLLRIGHFTDWFSQGHSLTRPLGAYVLTALPAHAAVPAAIGPCDWYRLAEGARARDLCWSRTQRLPLVIVDDAGRIEWRVTEMSPGPFASETFRIDDAGFAHNDANVDIAND